MMKIRNVSMLAMILALSAFVGMSSASADPFAGAQQWASYSARVKGTDGKIHQVALQAYSTTDASSTPQTAWITLDFSTCSSRSHCGAVTEYTKSIPTTAFTVSPDGTSAQLDTTFAGLPVKLAWTGAANHVNIIANGGSTGGQVGKATDATVAVTSFLGVACSGPGAISNAVAAYPSGGTTSGRAEPKSPPAGFARVPGKKASCAR